MEESDDPVIWKAGSSTARTSQASKSGGQGHLISIWVLSQGFSTDISSLRDERLPKGTRFAREPLDADTTTGPAFQAGPLPQLISGLRKVKAERGLLDYQWQEI